VKIPSKFNDYTVLGLPALDTNYLWLLKDNRSAILIDPGDANVCIKALENYNLRLDAVLVTHHHRDHTGGLAEIKNIYNCPIYGPEDNRIPLIDHILSEGDKFKWKSHTFDVWHCPGHTNSHIVYWNQQLLQLFCGDIIFGAGCGRNMEGQVSDLYYSLKRIAELPSNTELFCAHEYTLDNLLFAQKVEPGNLATSGRLEKTKTLRSENRSTLPLLLEIEKATNPFLRSERIDIRHMLDSEKNNPDIQLFLNQFSFKSDDEYYFALMRGWKNCYARY